MALKVRHTAGVGYDSRLSMLDYKTNAFRVVPARGEDRTFRQAGTSGALCFGHDSITQNITTIAIVEGQSDVLAVCAAARQQMRNAMLQLITTWPPTHGILNDYAHRQLSELMSQYYLKRWEAFFNVKRAELGGQKLDGEGGRSATQTTENNGEAVSTSYELSKSVDEVERNFRTAKLELLTNPKGSVIEQAARILEGK